MVGISLLLEPAFKHRRAPGTQPLWKEPKADGLWQSMARHDLAVFGRELHPTSPNKAHNRALIEKLECPLLLGIVGGRRGKY